MLGSGKQGEHKPSAKGHQQPRWKLLLPVAGGVLVCCLAAVGVLIGIAVARSRSGGGAQPGGAAGDAAPVPSSVVINSLAAPSDGADGPARQLRQLPAPGSAEADALLADASTPAWLQELYEYQGDGRKVTADVTAAWLRLLQQHLDTLARQGQQGKQQRQQQGVDLAPFIAVSQDVLSYLRDSRSAALLTLLREFAATGHLALNSVDPDQLRDEVRSVLSEPALSAWYRGAGAPGAAVAAGAPPGGPRSGGRRRQRRLLGAEASSGQDSALFGQLLGAMGAGGGDGGGAQAAAAEAAAPARPPGGAGRLSGSSTVQLAGDGEQQAGDPRSSSSGTGRRERAGQRVGAGSQLAFASAAAGGTAAAAAPPSAGGGTAAPALQPAAGLEETLDDMVCAAAVFAGVEQPRCPPVRPPAAGKAQRALLPLRFHVLATVVRVNTPSFLSTDAPHSSRPADVVLPPSFGGHHDNSAQRLVAGVNRLFAGTGVQFALGGVLDDVAAHPYLRQPDLDAWQACTHNAAAPAAGLDCLARVAASAAADGGGGHAIDVLVSGSRDDPTFCSATAVAPGAQPPLCSSLSRSYSAARGPWLPADEQPPAGWREGAPADNFVFISWDVFDAGGRNSGERGGAGAAMLAYELGHFLGLRDTHAGAPPCSAEPAGGDAVADTPPNLQLGSVPSPPPANLAGWCSRFRAGEGPPRSELEGWSSCPGHVDNVFNVMSITPATNLHVCSMVLTPQQGERLGWAMATYRPALLAASQA